MLRFKFIPKFSFIILFAFVVFTIVGTQLHELGHIAVAKYYGYETELYHDSMTYYHKGIMQDADYIKLEELYKRNKNLELSVSYTTRISFPADNPLNSKVTPPDTSLNIP